MLFRSYLESKNKGIFVLIRTSNPGAKDIEYLNVGDEYLYFKIGDKLCEMSEKFRGDCGYSSLGFVIGGTYSEEAVEIRKRYNNMFFLIPGYGAQGAKTEDIREYLNDFKVRPDGQGGEADPPRRQEHPGGRRADPRAAPGDAGGSPDPGGAGRRRAVDRKSVV